jgi:GABA(A) receptor-associated protein
MEQFKKEQSFDKRLESAEKILTRYPDRVPVLVFEDSNWYREDLPKLDKNKYLVPRDLTVGQFLYVIRKRIKLAPEKALFLFVGKGVLPATSALMSDIYEQHKDDDNFLVATICGESTFG